MDVHGRDLRYFATVAEELHFTRAAERLYVSQPALSKQIRALEKLLGTALFERDRREVRLTEAGAALLPHARRMLAEWDTARDTLDRVKADLAAVLVVGMSTRPGRGGMLPAIRSRFTAARPDARLTLRQVHWRDPTAGLADGGCDAAFVWLPLPAPDRYRWLVLAEEPCLVGMPATHPLAARESVDFTELLDEPFLALPESASPLRDHWLATDARGGRPALVGAEVANTEETYEALVAGLGVVLLAAGNAPLITLGGVVTRPVTGISPSRFALAWRAGDRRPLLYDYVRACEQATANRADPRGNQLPGGDSGSDSGSETGGETGDGPGKGPGNRPGNGPAAD